MMTHPVLPIPVMIAICVVLVLLKRKGFVSFIRQLIIVALLFAINLRISIPGDTVTQVRSDVDVLLVIDNTISMVAEDYNGSERRIDGVRKDVEKIIDTFEGARFSLITLTDVANPLIPYTNQYELIIQAVNELNGQTKAYGQGTTLNIAYDAMKENLSNISDLNEDAEENRAQLVFFISDGEITTGEDLKSFKKLAEYVDGGAVLGYGTEEGGTMKVRSYATFSDYETLYYYDNNYNYKVARSYIDEKNLKDIAKDLGIDYSHMTKPKSINSVLDEIEEIVESGELTRIEVEGEGYDETYWMFAIALAAFLFIDFVYYRWKLGKER